MSEMEEQSNILAEELQNYMSDSDVDDPKYSPVNKEPYNNTESSDRNIYSGEFQGKIMNLQKNVDIKNKNILELENELNLYKIELVSMREKLASKDNLISQYESAIQLSKDKINQLSQAAEKFKNENEILSNKNMDLEAEIKSMEVMQNKANAKNESVELIHQHMEDIQKEFNQKEINLNKKFKEKEDNLRKDFLNEISGLNKEIEDLRAENAKLKFENSDHNVALEKLNNEFDEKNFEFTSAINKKDKEISKLNEQLKDYQGRCEELESQFDQKNTFNEESLKNIKEERDTLLNELDEKDKKIFDTESEIDKLTNQINILKEEISRKEESLTNKEMNNDKLKNQILLLENSLNERDNEMEVKEQSIQKELSDQNITIKNLIQEKNQLLEEKAQLENSLNLATNKIMELNDIIQDNVTFFQSDRYKENEKNENIQKKLKGMIKKLKFREKSLTDENERLKNILSEKENEKQQMEISYQNELNNISLYNNFNNSQMLGINQPMNNPNLTNASMHMINNSMMVGNVNLPNQFISTTSYSCNLNDSREEGQKKTLEDFKKLLAKIDEKLDGSKNP
ncbi:MAG: hypothetical protein MJ252_08800 [archaeon]|nr:hypothetical protein [archaeon]